MPWSEAERNSEIFRNGMKYCWKMLMELYDMSAGERVDAIGYSDVREMVYDLDAVGVDKCLQEWKKLNEIQVGDEITYKHLGKEALGYVFKISNRFDIDVYNTQSKEFDYFNLYEDCSVHKTGSHCVDIEKLLTGLGEAK